MSLSSTTICLIGPMGAGKTTVGRRLAETLQRQFCDMDEELERRCGVTVSLIFEYEGEAGFRDRESRLLDELSTVPNLILATGGGVVLKPENRRVLRARCLTVYLQTSVERQLERLERDTKRPLLRGPDRVGKLEALARARDPLYLETADITVPSDGKRPARMADRVLEALRRENNFWHDPDFRAQVS
jgi:shikimate kinase